MASPTRSRRLFDPGLAVILALGGAGAVFVFADEGFSGVWRVILEDTTLFLGILPKVAAGCVIGAFLTLLIPRETIVRLVGTDSGLRGLLVATLAGIIIPGGPFTVFPITVAFLAVGADRGAAVAFVTAWHVIGLNRAVIWEMPFFGHDFVLTRVLISLPFPLIAGLIARLVPWPKREDGEA